VSAPVIDDVGIRPAGARPTRAIALAVLSRVILGLLMVVGLWTVLLAVGEPSRPAALAVPRTTVMVDRSGTDLAGLVERVVTGVGSTGGRLVELDVGTHVSRTAPVRMRVQQRGASGGEVDRLVLRTAAAGVDAAVPQGVTPVAGGFLIELEGSVLISPVGPDDGPVDARADLVVLSEVVERTGVRLRRLELLSDVTATVRLDVTGTLDELVALVTAVEQGHGAPLGIRSLRLRAADEHVADLDLVFALRGRGPTAAASAEGSVRG
jgi:hypothetical protein